MNSSEWYRIKNIDQLDSPCFVVYPDRAKANIETLIRSVNDKGRLRPHIKTHKSAEISRMMLDSGISKFKCATISEAEMLVQAGAKDILLAYQPVGPKAERFAELVQKFPSASWGCLVDNIHSAEWLSKTFEKKKMTIPVFIDLNVGMNRTGIAPAAAFELFTQLEKLHGLIVKGVHAYDGHLRDTDYNLRKEKCDQAFSAVEALVSKIEKQSGKKLTMVAGGTPTFSIHCKRNHVECSPGTFVYWDKGYENILKEQNYLHAGLVVTRVVSLPAEGMICTDLGHKAIAAENPLPNRVSFLNAPDLEPVGHSEEHMVFKITGGSKYNVGDVLYGVPYHICPTVALHEIAHVVTNGVVSDGWITQSRRRKLTI